MNDKTVMEGGPDGSDPLATELGTGSASPAPTSSPGASAPGMQEVTVNGVTFAVSEAMAKAFNAEKEHAALRITDLQAGLEAAKTRSVAAPAASPAPGIDPAATSSLGTYNWETKLFENPAEAMREAINIAKNEAKSELRVEYAQTRAQEIARETFWKDFYETNDHLKGKEKVVDFITNRDPDLAAMSLSAAKEAIKERVHTFLKEAGVNIPSGSKGPPIVEGGPEKAPKTVTAPAPQGERGKSLGDVLRDRSKQRAETRHSNMKMVK